MLDVTDREILRILQRDGRTPYAEIASAVGLSVSAVNERVRKLAARGAILGTEARLAPGALGLGLLAFVRVRLAGVGHDDGFVAAVAGCDAVQECHHITGEYSYLLKLRAADATALERLLVEVIQAAPGVAATETAIALSSAKESAALPVPGPEAEAGR